MPIQRNNACPAIVGSTIHMVCTRSDGSGVGTVDLNLQWKMGDSDEPDIWTEGPAEEWSLQWDAANHCYMLNGFDMDPAAFTTFRCAPQFKATQLGVEIGNILYDITLEGGVESV